MTQKAIKTELLLLDRGGERGGGREDFTGKEGGERRGGEGRGRESDFLWGFFFSKRPPSRSFKPAYFVRMPAPVIQ